MLIRSLLIISTLLIFNPRIHSQIVEDSLIEAVDEYDKNAFIGVNYGWSRPMGSFAIPSADDESGSAFAENGNKLAIFDFGYRIKKGFFGGLSFINLNNDINTEELGRYLSNDEFLVRVNSTDYELRALMLGIGFTKFSNTVDFDLRFNIGYGTTYLPSFEIQQKNRMNDEVEEFVVRAENESGFGIGLNAGLRIHLNEYLDFTTNGSYIIFQKSFEELETNDPNNSQSTASINYEVISISFGLAYRFNIKLND